jgi:nitrogen fixation protein NifU and related proteins
MDPLYREIILEHWQNPQNYGVIKNPDFDMSENNPLCGDKIRLTGKISDGKLVKIAFSGEGCAISKASASLFTDEIKGNDIDKIKRINEYDVLKLLGIELTPARIKCALLIYKTLQKSLKSKNRQ